MGHIAWKRSFKYAWVAAMGTQLLIGESTNYFQPPATRRMAERLEAVAQGIHPENSTFFSAERVEHYQALLRSPQTPESLLQILPSFSAELLNAGETERAISMSEKMVEVAKTYDPVRLANNKLSLLTWQAVAHLRLGEEQNCLSNHTTDSCLLPIQGNGIHKLQTGSRRAIEILTGLLQEFPEDLRARWLLNIAYMTVGEYPDKVPARWLVPTNVFEAEYPMKRFVDVAGPAGVDIYGNAGGSIMEDFDGDGLLDIMTSAMGLRDRMHFFHNNGDGTFADRTMAAGLQGEVGGLSLVQTDYNNDGQIDVLVLRGAWFGTEGHHPRSLLRNNGDGTFTDVTEEAGLLSFHPTQAAVWFDFNNDGWLDLFIGNESYAGDNNPCELYRNNGDGTFTECAAEAGLATIAFVKGVTASDYNNDGRTDLYLSCKGGPNILFRNDGPREPNGGVKGPWKFTDVSKDARVSDQHHSFTTWFWDYDNDGWPDIFVAGYNIQSVADVAADYLGLAHTGERARLYHNNHDGTFTDVSRETHLFKLIHAMGANFGDLDNDGFLDFYAGTGDPDLATLIPNRMFRNSGGKVFQEVTTSGGFGHLQKGHGVSFGDIDNDGDQDIFEVMGGAYPGDKAFSVLYENPGNENHWITLKLEGTKSNRAAIGARIKVLVNSAEGKRQICRTVGTGGSFGCNPLRQEIGLGNATGIESIEVFWPVTGKTQVFGKPQMNQFYLLREESKDLAQLHLPTFKFSSQHAQHHHMH